MVAPTQQPLDLVRGRTIMHTDDILTISFEIPVADLNKLMVQGLDIALRDIAKAVLKAEADRLLKERLSKIVSDLVNEPERLTWLQDYAKTYINEVATSRITAIVDRTIAKATADLQARILGRTGG